jgi:hypothetical protein
VPVSHIGFESNPSFAAILAWDRSSSVTISESSPLVSLDTRDGLAFACFAFRKTAVLNQLLLSVSQSCPLQTS